MRSFWAQSWSVASHKLKHPRLRLYNNVNIAPRCQETNGRWCTTSSEDSSYFENIPLSLSLGLSFAKKLDSINYLKIYNIDEDKVKDSFNELKESAKSGNVGDQFTVGLYLKYTTSTHRNVYQGFNFIRSYVNSNVDCNPISLYELGKSYFFGVGTVVDLKRAVHYFRLAADKNYPRAQYELGICYQKGLGVDVDLHKAVELVYRAANSNIPEALHKIGEFYERGTVLEQSNERAFTFYQKAVKLEYPPAMLSLGQCYQNGVGCDHNIYMAVDYYHLAAGRFDNAEAQNMLGMCYFMGAGVPRRYPRAFQYFLLSSFQKCPAGLYNVGVCYYNGHGTKKDLTLAQHNFMMSHSLGFTPEPSNTIFFDPPPESFFDKIWKFIKKQK